MCSKSKPGQTVGAVEMIRGALRALLDRFPKTTTILLTDKSYITIDHNDIALPERNMIVYGQTWYEEHFGAIPTNGNDEHKLQVWKAASFDHTTKRLARTMAPTEMTTLIKERALPALSGLTWQIPLTAVSTWNMSHAEFKEGVVGGGMHEWNKPNESILLIRQKDGGAWLYQKHLITPTSKRHG